MDWILCFGLSVHSPFLSDATPERLHWFNCGDNCREWCISHQSPNTFWFPKNSICYSDTWRVSVLGRGWDCNVLLFLCGDMFTINLKQKKKRQKKKKQKEGRGWEAERKKKLVDLKMKYAGNLLAVQTISQRRISLSTNREKEVNGKEENSRTENTKTGMKQGRQWQRKPSQVKSGGEFKASVPVISSVMCCRMSRGPKKGRKHGRGEDGDGGGDREGGRWVRFKAKEKIKSGLQ